MSEKFSELPPYFYELRDFIAAGLQNLQIPKEPNALYQPVHYSLESTGKFLRPTLLITIGEQLGAKRDTLLYPALAIELLHTFTLIHDDIMDKALQRRGRATIHTKWDTNTAILAGDALFALVFELLLKNKDSLAARLGYEIAQTTYLICAGQALDIEFEKRLDVSEEEYLQMITWKTGHLIGLACSFGALIAETPEEVVSKCRQFGIKLGQAFQVQDDLLEITADVEKMGKSLISDIATGKKTYPVILILKQLPEKERGEWLKGLSKQAFERDKIRKIFQDFDVIQKTALLAEKLFNEAESILEDLNLNNPEILRSFINYIKHRQF